MSNCNHPYVIDGKCMPCGNTHNVNMVTQYWQWDSPHHTYQQYWLDNKLFGECISHTIDE